MRAKLSQNIVLSQKVSELISKLRSPIDLWFYYRQDMGLKLLKINRHVLRVFLDIFSLGYYFFLTNSVRSPCLPTWLS